MFKVFYQSLFPSNVNDLLRMHGFLFSTFYFFLILVISTSAYFILLSRNVKNVSDHIQLYLKDVPDFYIENGTLHSNFDGSYYIEHDDVLFYFEPGATIENLPDIVKSDNYSQVFGIFQDGVIYRFMEVNALPFNLLGSFSIDKKGIMALIETGENYLLVVLLIGFFIVLLLKGIWSYFLSILLLFVLLVVDKLSSIGASLSDLWKMIMFSITFPILYQNIFYYLQVKEPLQHWIIWGLMTILYLTQYDNQKIKEN